ncbi:CAP domain-containing protein [Actinoplanes sp. N902-109]|uniref:CAP domain-containing protein n=1 Tax=Actinoplanes sp. (strain N902-109) TaxID=649831 RepID=UPI001E3884DD|nr:CAP domain-containing protein [Actinoplanes sp. N902-109]
MTAAQKFRYTMAAGATAVVIGVGFTTVGLNRHAAGTADRTAAEAPLVASSPIDLGDGNADLLLDDASAAPSATPSATPSARKPTTPAPKPARKTASPKPKPKPTPTKRRTSKPAAGTAGAPTTSGSILDQVLAHINTARADEGLPAYTLSNDLSKASALHNDLMIDGCGLSHQCSGEGGIGDRFSAQDVRWSSAGENIGYGSAGSSDAAVIKAANGLTDSMLAEKAPNDGHRKNLLSDGFEKIGLSVVRDSQGVVWMTQDFVG